MKRILIFILAIVILAFGTAICNYTGLGIDPINAFGIAISELTTIQLGTILLVMQFCLGIVVFIFKRDNIGVGTIIPILTFGYFLQFFNWLFATLLIVQSNFFVNISIFIVGMLIIAFGMSLYMQCKLGMVPYDSLAFILEKYFNGRAAIYRMLLDSTVAIIAFVLGGPINVGTILLAISIGPLIDFYRNQLFKNIKI